VSKNRVELPTQRTSEPAAVTAKGFEHLQLSAMTDATSATRHAAVLADTVLADTPPARIDLKRVDNGVVQHPPREIKHKVRGAAVTRRERILRAIDLRDIALDRAG
jgi:hypothetical protein